MHGARRALTLFAAALAVASCGGGGGAETPDSPPVSGTLDPTYGTAGRISVPQGFNNVVIDRAGNVFVGGGAITKFDTSGRAAAEFVDAAPAISTFVQAVDASGNVYAIQLAAGGVVSVVKRDASGRLAASFGQGGFVDMNAVRATVSADRVFVDTAGNVYVSALWRPPTSARPVVHFIAKLDVAGRPVTSFGTRGDGTLELPSDFNLAFAATVDAAGNTFVFSPASVGNIVIAAFDANGQPAGAFRSTPVPVPCASPITDTPMIERDAAGNIYAGVSCSASAGTRRRVVILKLDAAGNPVSTFGTGGVVADFFAPRPGENLLAAMQPSADGGLYVIDLEFLNECGGGDLAKLGTDGRLVDAFGTHGIAPLDMAFGIKMAVDASGRLYVAGRDRPTVCPRLLGTQLSYSVYRFNG